MGPSFRGRTTCNLGRRPFAQAHLSAEEATATTKTWLYGPKSHKERQGCPQAAYAQGSVARRRLSGPPTFSIGARVRPCTDGCACNARRTSMLHSRTAAHGTMSFSC